MEVVAVDLGGTNIRAARVNSAGKILARGKVPTHGGEGMAAVAERIAELIDKVRSPATCAAGIGTPGVPDPVSGDMLSPAVNIPGSAGFPLCRTLSRRTGLRVMADNDGNLAALGESWLGAGAGEPTVLIFTIGTGIGGGFVVDGKVYHGHHNLGTEFGHVSIDFAGRNCACGGKGCVEAYASAAALGRDARDALQLVIDVNSSEPAAGRTSLSKAGFPPGSQKTVLLKICGGAGKIDRVDAQMVCDGARKNDPLACFLLDRCCDWLACAVGSLINALNPSCVILGGGMALAGETVTSRVMKALQRGRAYGPILKNCKLRVAKLGDDSGLLGAARMALLTCEPHNETCPASYRGS